MAITSSSPPARSSSGARSSSKSSSPSASSVFRNNKPIDPITRTALRYTISPREYALLHTWLLSRAPKPVQRRTPDPARFERMVAPTRQARSKTTDGKESNGAASGGGGGENAAAVRAAWRVFLVVFLGMKGWEGLVGLMARRKKGGSANPAAGGATVKYGNVRVALSFSGILLFHRLLGRFFTRLRALLLEENARPFRKRNPGIARLLTSRYTPVIGAAMAGSMLAVAPADKMRRTIAIYVMTRAAEFAYNALEESGTLWGFRADGKPARPAWFGSWLVMPYACGQLLHAFAFDRDCFPADYGAFIMQRSPEYIAVRPRGYAGKLPWPGTFDIVDALAELGRLRWPPFVSPILFPGATLTASSPSAALARITPVVAPASPAIKHASCALLHPHDPSCARVYAKQIARSFPTTLRFFGLIYGGFALLAYKSLFAAPVPFLSALSSRVLRMSAFITLAIATSWASLCASNALLPRTLIPTQRLFLGGFAGGAWAYLARSKERANFLYSLRLSIESTWLVGRKRGWWRGWPNGDVALFTVSLALLQIVYHVRPDAVRGTPLRKGISLAMGEGWTDPVVARAQKGKESEVVKEKVEKRDEQEEALGEQMKKDE